MASRWQPFTSLLVATCLCQLAAAQVVTIGAPGPATVLPFPDVPTAPAISPSAAQVNGSGGALALTGVQKLTPGVLTPVQTVSFNNFTFFYFVLPNATVDIQVDLIQGAGDADLYIVEPGNPAPFANNGFDTNGWASGTAANESIFIPRTDPYYTTGTYAVGVFGFGKGVSQFQLLVQFTAQKRVLAPSQFSALQSIYDTCCDVAAGACENIVVVGGVDPTGAISTEMCEYPGWECTFDGQLEIADFTQFGLTCPFPWTALLNMTSLEILRLSNNSLTGPVDWTTLAKLPQLTTLDIDQNALNGTVSCNLATAGTPFLELDVSNNQFTGALPVCYVQKPEMRVIRMNNNKFTGTLPATIPSNSQLRSVHIANSGASGNLTADFGLPPYLQTIELSQNNISGTIPAGIAGPGLDGLLLNGNRLTGTIPTALTTAPQMRTLYLHNNQLTGGIDAFASAPNLQFVTLHLNNLLGAMPQTWTSQNLMSLNIMNNFISGPIPTSLLTLPNLFAFAAGNNNLSGPLPTLPANQTSALRVFNVTSNKLTGAIPANYVNLPVFDARSAKLIPGTQSVLLQVFDASYNILTGTIPAFFQSSQLPVWATTDLSGNELTCSGVGTIAKVTCGSPAGVSIGGSAGPNASKGPASSNSTATTVTTAAPGLVGVVTSPGPSTAAAAAALGTTSSSSSSTGSSSNAGPLVSPSHKGLSAGAIAGIVIGIILGVLLLAALAVFGVARLTKRRRESVQAKSFKRFASMDAEPV